MRVVKDSISQGERNRYTQVVEGRVKEIVEVRIALLKKNLSNRNAFLSEHGVLDEYLEMEKLEKRVSELKSIVGNSIGTCRGLEYVLKQRVDESIACDPEIVNWRKKLRKWKERIELAKTFDELDSILLETNDI